MPKVIERTVYTFDELSDEAKRRARDWYREGAFIYDWWDSVYEDAKLCLKFLGWSVDDICFEMHVQGAGACFAGRWDPSDVDLKGLSEHAPQDEELARLGVLFACHALRYPEGSGRSVHSHRSCHEMAATIEVFDSGGDEVGAGVDEETFVESTRDCMLWIFKQLEAEWKYLNSDEQVDESITANEYTFDEDGRREG